MRKCDGRSVTSDQPYKGGVQLDRTSENVKTVEWTREGVALINQRLLPVREEYEICRSYQEVAEAIRSMVVRGAPAIGVAAAMGIALGVKQCGAATAEALRPEFTRICDTLAATRPTAVNLFWAIARMKDVFEPTRRNLRPPDPTLG